VHPGSRELFQVIQCRRHSLRTEPVERPELAISRGAIFHVLSKRRRVVEFTSVLRAQTEAAVARLHELVASGRIPLAVLMPKCEGCSLHEICMPELSLRKNEIGTASAQLFKPD
jgi:CRISPR-associated exonuclease Cas4